MADKDVCKGHEHASAHTTTLTGLLQSADMVGDGLPPVDRRRLESAIGIYLTFCRAIVVQRSAAVRLAEIR